MSRPDALSPRMAAHLAQSGTPLQPLTRRLLDDGDAQSLLALIEAQRAHGLGQGKASYPTMRNMREVMAWMGNADPERQAVADAWVRAAKFSPELSFDTALEVMASRASIELVQGLLHHAQSWIDQLPSPWPDPVREQMGLAFSSLLIDNVTLEESNQRDVQVFEQLLKLNPKETLSFSCPSAADASSFLTRSAFSEGDEVPTIGVLAQLGMENPDPWFDAMARVHGQDRLPALMEQAIERMNGMGIKFRFRAWLPFLQSDALMNDAGVQSLASGSAQNTSRSSLREAHALSMFGAFFHPDYNPNFCAQDLRAWIDRGVDVNETQFWHTQNNTLLCEGTALHIAALQPNPEALKALIEAGANLEMPMTETPLRGNGDGTPQPTTRTAIGWLQARPHRDLAENLAILQSHQALQSVNDMVQRLQRTNAP